MTLRPDVIMSCHNAMSSFVHVTFLHIDSSIPGKFEGSREDDDKVVVVILKIKKPKLWQQDGDCKDVFECKFLMSNEVSLSRFRAKCG
nr:hypothetical protein [Tanacetum cinerariifolium]